MLITEDAGKAELALAGAQGGYAARPRCLDAQGKSKAATPPKH
ncbi:MAG: hypothetical protein ORN29_09485 [Rhodoferax sp.]|nr:hypothetical protein [Rhodoferax sp.]